MHSKHPSWIPDDLDITHLTLATSSFILLAIVYYNISIPGGMPGLWADELIYILLAEYLSPLSPELRTNAAHVSQFGGFPPLYPFLLSLIGTSQQNLVPAHLMTGTFNLLSIVIFYFWLKRYFPGNATPLLFSILLAMLPYSLILAPAILSEPLYLMLSLAIFYLADTKDHALCPYCTAVLVALAVLARSSGIALLLAYIIWIIVNKKRRQINLVLVALTPIVTWNLLASFIYPTQGYLSELFSVYGNLSIDALALQLVSQFSAHGKAWHHYLDRNSNSYSLITVTTILLLILPGYLARLKRRALDAFYFPIYIALVIIWPFPAHAERFLFPIVPVALFYALYTIQIISTKRLQLASLFFFFSLILVTILPSSTLILQRGMTSNDDIPPQFLHTTIWLESDKPKQAIASLKIIDNLYDGMRTAGRLIPESACVYTMHFEAFMYYGRRFSKPLLPKYITANRIHEQDQCEYLFVLWTNSHRAFEPGYPLTRFPLEVDLIYQKLVGKDQQIPVAELYRIIPANSH